MSLCVVYLASPRSFMTGRGGTGHSRYDVLKVSLERTRRALPTVDIIVFHEDYTEEDIRGLPSGIRWVPVDFSGFESIYNPALPTSRGYLMMCRFFSGVMQSHPVLQSYSHYIRMDDDSFFLTPPPSEAHLRTFLPHDYVFRAQFIEAKSQHSLYTFTMTFLATAGVLLPFRRRQIEQRLLQQGVLTPSGVYTGLAPYNNYHLSSLRLWRRPLVRRYLQAIESSGGIFRNGWLDANIHAMLVFVFPHVLDISVRSDTSFGYRHNYHVCPIGRMFPVCDESLPFIPTETE